MGKFHHPLEVGDFDGRRFEELDAFVDTGATHTSVPQDALERLGVMPDEETDVHMGMAWVRTRLNGREPPTTVIIGDPGSNELLGAFTLEGYRPGVDSVNRQLVETPGYLVGIVLQRRP